MIFPQNTIRRLQVWWTAVFWVRPFHLWALKVSLSVSVLLIPLVSAGLSGYGITLAMGVIAMALTETDTHPQGRLKSFGITLVMFFIATVFIELLYPSHPLLFAVWLATGIFLMLLAGGMSSRWQSISFGSVLVSVYAMIGARTFDQWYLQPLLLTAGAFCYGLLSWLFLVYRPTRLLEEQLSLAFYRLSEYLEMKSNLFPSETQGQEQRRNELAQKNVEVVQQIERYRSELFRYLYESNAAEKKHVSWMYHRWELLQELHERAASSHERYDVLSRQTSHLELIEGFGVFMSEIASALALYADAVLREIPYKHPIALHWTSSALYNLLQLHPDDPQYAALTLLYKNLNRIENALSELTQSQSDATDFKSAIYIEKPFYNSLLQLMNYKHPRFRFAVRMSLSFLVGYGIIYFFAIQNGEWILLTSLLVNQQTYSATRLRLWHRVVGTFVGVILGALICDLLPTKGGQIILYVGSVYAFFYWVRKRYTTAVIFITIFVMSAFNIQSGQGFSVLLPRLADTLIGAVIAYMSVRFLWVDWQYKQLPQLVRTALLTNTAYWQSILSGTPLGECRTQAHIADNALTTAWKNMSVEPKKKRIPQQTAYRLTFLNHALLSYMSAFSIQGKSAFSDEEKEMCETITTILTQTRQHLSAETTVSEIDIENYRQAEEKLLLRKRSGENPTIILLHNITRISVDLLSEVHQSGMRAK
ncbi:MAG: FUSC family membrane protein [Capnocytophaga sp.]|nr:FUSC family membrane protein [Capnocytophaga sp.]